MWRRCDIAQRGEPNATSRDRRDHQRHVELDRRDCDDLVHRGERGSVTAEFALTLVAAVAVLAAMLVAASAGLAQMRCADAARAGARAAAVGEASDRVEQIAVGVAGPDAAVSVAVDGEWVVVTVSAPVAAGGFGRLRAEATSRAWIEPGTPAGTAP